MKTLSIATLSLGLSFSPAWALDIAPYSAATLAARQQAGEAVSLHFHADWCPTCRAQSQVFESLRNDATVPGTLLVVNYDKERDIKKKLGVRTQSTLIVYRGTDEKTRLAGETDAGKLRAALQASR